MIHPAIMNEVIKKFHQNHPNFSINEYSNGTKNENFTISIKFNQVSCFIQHDFLLLLFEFFRCFNGKNEIEGEIDLDVHTSWVLVEKFG